MNKEDRNDMSLPEGFAPDANGNFMGIPPWAMRQANMLMGSCTGNRNWDVAQIGRALADVFDQRMNEILENVKQTVEQSLTKLQSERQVTREQLDMPLDAAIRKPTADTTQGPNAEESISVTDSMKKTLARTLGGTFDVAKQEFHILDLEGGVDYDAVVQGFIQKAKEIDVRYGTSHAPAKALVYDETMWRLVPKMHNGKAGLTHEMSHAFYAAVQKSSHRGDFERLNAGYNAMLRAAPKTPGWEFKRYSQKTLDLARRVLEQRDNDMRTDEQKIADGVAFICDTRLDQPVKQVTDPIATAVHKMNGAALHRATLALLDGTDYHSSDVDWWAERRFRFSDWKLRVKAAIDAYIGDDS
jgi:hypothetical protein